MATKAVRNVRKLERPRPLKVPSEGSRRQNTVLAASGDSSTSLNDNTVEDVIQDLESLHISINNGNLDDTTLSKIIKVCSQLKSKGSQLETNYKEQLDRYFVTLRNASREERLNELCRVRLLEVIELRAMMWKTNDNLNNYYKQKIIHVEGLDQQSTGSVIPSLTTSQSVTTAPPGYLPGQNSLSVSSTNQSQLSLTPGEVLKSSGKFAKPTKIPGKNYFKDEIVIRNSDSGKVMGIKGRRVHMIEELSDTVISFQRVSPGARDRLVQITGSNEESIEHAKALIEDTIRRNASPVREKTETPGLECSGSSSSLASNLSEDSGAGPSPFNISSRKSLIHSYSTGDATMGEYSHTVYIGRDTIKVFSEKKDLVTAAKLVLEEHFAGQAEIVEKQRRQTAMHSYMCGGDNRRPLSMFSVDFSPFRQDSGQWDFSGAKDVIPGYPNYADPAAKVSTWLCNDTKTVQTDQEASPRSSSSSDEETYKAEEEASPTDDEKSTNREVAELPLDSPLQSPQPVNEPKPFTVEPVSSKPAPGLMKAPSHPEVRVALNLSGSESSSVKVVRQPLFPDSSKEAVEQAESTTTLNALSAKARRAHFARMSSVNAVVESKQEPSSAVTSISRISYSREFLLNCALSPHSCAFPVNLVQIAKDAPYIIRQTSTRFDPAAYRAQTSAKWAKQVSKSDTKDCSRSSPSDEVSDNM
ncbi:eukaryotic translation initiation factor 4E-binding protein Mextli-like isoform X1 [Limulus polyphemus]|uniref:Eukaryotic translation initiation factor 4E-binding protein Mextli-like isoform X1 n=1 Tax=Limulus polyphemus TaxID=6850 RepID=A0ABM1BKH4_LIMPO|nr:eukaryotic translation initiation factor 4E-binding protein Mextli-like isoform X1 [Limulus polyphemus]